MAEVGTEAVNEAPLGGTDAAEKAALIAEIEGELDEESEGGSGASEHKAQKKPPRGARAGGDEESGEREDEADPEDDAAEGGPGSISELREHVRELVLAGDIRKVEEALGLEKGALKVDGARFRHMRQRAEKADKARSEAEQRHAEAANIVTQAQQEYGPMVRAKQLFQSGNPQGVQQAGRFVERHFGCSLAQFVDSVVKAGRGEGTPQRGPDPEVAELKAALLEMKQAQERERAQQTERAAADRHISTIKSKLSATPLAKLPDAAKLVYERLKGSYDRTIDGYTMTLRDAIAAVQEDPGTKWRLHEMRERSTPTKTGGAARERPAGGRQPARREPERGRLSPAEAEAAEKSALLAELEAEERRKERAARHGKR